MDSRLLTLCIPKFCVLDCQLRSPVYSSGSPLAQEALGVPVQDKTSPTRVATKEQERKPNREINNHKQPKSHARYGRKAGKFQQRAAN